MPYEFSRFSPQSFERFAQAVAAKAFGPGISLFGAGPDGAREASFQGSLPITTHGAQWNGYVVVQAKYKTNSRGGGEDAAWLGKELTSELDKFLDTKRNLKTPEYYLLITNVMVTPKSRERSPIANLLCICEPNGCSRRTGFLLFWRD